MISERNHPSGGIPKAVRPMLPSTHRGAHSRKVPKVDKYFQRLISSMHSNLRLYWRHRSMAEYHPFQYMERDEEVATPLSISTKIVISKLWRFLPWFCFFSACACIIVSLVAGHHAISIQSASARDLSFLSTFPGDASAVQIVADRNHSFP